MTQFWLKTVTFTALSLFVTYFFTKGKKKENTKWNFLNKRIVYKNLLCIGTY